MSAEDGEGVKDGGELESEIGKDMATAGDTQETYPTEKEQGTTEKESSSATPEAASTPTKTTKVDVLLKPAGNAPILKKKRWTVDRHKKIGWISDFIRKFIRTETEDSVFVYVNQSFAPSPDTDIGTLFDCFGSDGKLVIYYCRTQAWGWRPDLQQQGHPFLSFDIIGNLCLATYFSTCTSHQTGSACKMLPYVHVLILTFIL